MLACSATDLIIIPTGLGTVTHTTVPNLPPALSGNCTTALKALSSTSASLIKVQLSDYRPFFVVIPQASQGEAHFCVGNQPLVSIPFDATHIVKIKFTRFSFTGLGTGFTTVILSATVGTSTSAQDDNFVESKVF